MGGEAFTNGYERSVNPFSKLRIEGGGKEARHRRAWFRGWDRAKRAKGSAPVVMNPRTVPTADAQIRPAVPTAEGGKVSKLTIIEDDHFSLCTEHNPDGPVQTYTVTSPATAESLDPSHRRQDGPEHDRLQAGQPALVGRVRTAR